MRSVQEHRLPHSFERTSPALDALQQKIRMEGAPAALAAPTWGGGTV